jgi:hypothetical protein
MRTIIATYAGLLALCAISVRAAPLPPAKAHPTGMGISPPVELVAHGCGYGYKRTQWQDQWGRWHWGHCISKMHRNLSRENMAN